MGNKLRKVSLSEIKGINNSLCALSSNGKEPMSLLEHAADINVVDSENRNPLHDAVMHGRKKIAKLLANQLTINSKDKNGFTPLHLSALQDDD